MVFQSDSESSLYKEEEGEEEDDEDDDEFFDNDIEVNEHAAKVQEERDTMLSEERLIIDTGDFNVMTEILQPWINKKNDIVEKNKRLINSEASQKIFPSSSLKNSC